MRHALKRLFAHTSRPRRPSRRQALWNVEPLESRLLLSAIVWDNKGDDGFDEVFSGQQLTDARAVVQAAIDSWARVIVDFNEDDDNDPTTGLGSTDEPFLIDVTMDVDDLDDRDNGGSGDADGIGGSGIPFSGEITLGTGSDGQGAGWFIDPTPYDSAEFRGNVINAFAGDASPAVGNDMFTVVVAEMLHVLGLTDDVFSLLQLNQAGFLTSTGTTDAAFNLGTLWTFDGPNVDALLTSNNGGASGSDFVAPIHVAEPNVAHSFGGTFFGAQDAGNAVYEGSRRYLPSRLDALLLQDAYGYQVAAPESFGTFYANFDPTTGNLLLRGGMRGEGIYGITAGSNDSITLSREGGLLRVDMSIGTPVPGTAANTILTSFFDFAAIQSITISGGDVDNGAGTDGDDIYSLNFSQGTVVPVDGITIQGNGAAVSGDDSLFVFGPAGASSYTITSDDLTIGGLWTIDYSAADMDHLTVVADSAGGDNGFSVDGTESFDDILLVGSAGTDTLRVDEMDEDTVTTIQTLAGDDTIFLSLVGADLDDVEGAIFLDGGVDTDRLHIFDQTDSSDTAYILGTGGATAEGLFQRDTTLSLFFDGVEDVEFNASLGDNQIDVTGTPVGTSFAIDAGLGSDVVRVDSNGAAVGGTVDDVRGSVRIDGGLAGTDDLIIGDSGDGDANQAEVTENTVVSASSGSFFGVGGGVGYTNFSSLTLDMGRGGDTVAILSTSASTPVEVNTDVGQDLVIVGAVDTTREQGDVSQVVSLVTVDGGQKDGAALLIADAKDLTPDTATLTPTGIQSGEVGLAPGDSLFGPGGAVVYTAIHTLTLSAGAGGDTIHIPGTPVGTSVIVNAGGGDDTIDVDDSGPAVAGGTVDLVRSSLTVRGEAGHDVVTLEDSSDTTIDVARLTAVTLGAEPSDTLFGADGSLTYFSLEELTLAGGSGGNLLFVRGTATGTTTTLNTGAGNDQVQVDSNDIGLLGTVDGVLSPLIIAGGAGSNGLVLNDPGDASADVVTVSATQVGAGAGDTFFGPGGSVTYSDMTLLTLHAGAGNDVIAVVGTAPGTPTIVDGGGGLDAMRVDDNGAASLGTVDGVQSSLTIAGGVGLATLVLEDTGDTSGDRVTLTATQVGAAVGDTLFGPGGALTFSGLASLDVAAGSGADVFNVLATAAGTATTLKGEGGNDTFLVDSNGGAVGGTVNTIVSTLTIGGGTGINDLILEDGTDLTPDVVTVTGTSVGATAGDSFFGASGALNYLQLATLKLNAGAGGDAITVRATAAGTMTTVNAGGGNDTLAVDSNGPAANGTVDGVVSKLAMHGGTGTNALTLEDRSDLTADVVSVTPTSVGQGAFDTFFGAGGSMKYANLSTLTLNLGVGADFATIEGTAKTTSTAINTGGGDDKILVDDNGGAAGGSVDKVRGPLAIDGGTGTNRLLLEDSSDTTADQVTVTPTGANSGTVGLGAGDTFFESGGSLTYANLFELTLQMGDKEGDRVRLSPSPTLAGTRFVVDGNGPTAAPGDTLELNLTGVVAPVLNSAAGTLTSASHAPVFFIEMEAVVVV